MIIAWLWVWIVPLSPSKSYNSLPPHARTFDNSARKNATTETFPDCILSSITIGLYLRQNKSLKYYQLTAACRVMFAHQLSFLSVHAVLNDLLSVLSKELPLSDVGDAYPYSSIMNLGMLGAHCPAQEAFEHYAQFE